MKISSVKEMRELDRTAIRHYGIKEELLMENAGEATYTVIRNKIGIRDKKFVIVCGGGNNGGGSGSPACYVVVVGTQGVGGGSFNFSLPSNCDGGGSPAYTAGTQVILSFLAPGCSPDFCYIERINGTCGALPVYPSNFPPAYNHTFTVNAECWISVLFTRN